MDLKRLRTLVTVADCGTVSGAAKMLRATQPALSRQLQDLQAEFGLALFDQVGRRLRLTSEGAELVHASRTLLRQADALLDYGRSLSGGDSGELRVGATAHMIANVFPAFLRSFAAKYPRVHITPVEAGGIEQWELLRRGELHAAISLLEGREGEFILHELPPITVLVASNPRWMRPLRTAVEMRELVGYPLLLLKSGFGTRRVFDAACRLERMTPNIFIESSAPETLLALAREGHGVALVPTSARADRRSLHLKRLHLQGKPLTMEMSVLWNRERRLPRYAEDFSSIFATHMRTAESRMQPD